MSENIFYDCFGRLLKARTCEYCGVIKPEKHWITIEAGKNVYNVLMYEFTGRDGCKAWKCRDCAADMEEK